MLTLSTIFLRPLVGAVIGYITNDIAIRMLFRPRTAKYIFGHKIPFTPGLIPKEKGRIASSIGEAISKNLMNREVLERTLLSEEMLDKIGNAIDSFIDTQRSNSETFEQFLSHFVAADDIQYVRSNIASDLSAQIHSVLATAQLGTKIAHIVIEHVMTKVRNGLLGKFGADQFLSMIASPAENLLAKNINEMLANHSEEMVGTLIDDQIGNFMEVPMKNLFAGREAQIEKARTAILNMYVTLVTKQLPRVLEAVNISKIIESRINEMDVKESEQLILQVMKKELNAIVWLGALLGFLMGCVNLLF